MPWLKSSQNSFSISPLVKFNPSLSKIDLLTEYRKVGVIELSLLWISNKMWWLLTQTDVNKLMCPLTLTSAVCIHISQQIKYGDYSRPCDNLSPEGVVRYTPTPLLSSKLQQSCKTYIIHISNFVILPLNHLVAKYSSYLIWYK